MTGGVGMGKSTAGMLLRARGVEVVDTDVLARQLVAPGQPALEAIRQTFGPTVIDPGGRLQRAALAEIIFADAAARRQLEAILHPRIRAAWMAATEQWRAAGRAVGVVVIPLLFETQAAPHFDATLCVACSAATQYQRLAERGWAAAQTAQRVQAQWPVEKKMALADYAIWTEGLLEVTAAQLQRVVGC